MKRKQTAWKKSRKFGDIYGGRTRLRLNDNIFMRVHSLKKPSKHDKLPVLMQDNPSRDYFFPISVLEANEAIKALPKRDFEAITHIWLRRFKKSEYEKGDFPLAEFICGSGVRAIIIYPFSRNMLMSFGAKKLSAGKLNELGKWCSGVQKSDGNWVFKWNLAALRKFYISNLLYHEVGHHVDWYNRHWSKANSKKLEEFANQYAIQKTATAIHIFNRMEKRRKNSLTE